MYNIITVMKLSFRYGVFDSVSIVRNYMKSILYNKGWSSKCKMIIENFKYVHVHNHTEPVADPEISKRDTSEMGPISEIIKKNWVILGYKYEFYS
jgi:hypothetical protein